VKIIQPMEDKPLKNLSLLVQIIIKSKLKMKRRVARRKVKEIA